MTVFGEDAYPTLVDKATALCFSPAKNHGFQDGNKRIAQAAMESFLMQNGFEIQATTDEQEKVILSVAASEMSREELADWVCEHLAAIED